MNGRPPSQADYPKFLFVTCTCHLILSSGSNVRGVLHDGYVIPSRHAVLRSAVWVDPPCSLQPVCQRHGHAIASLLASPLRGHGFHSHVSQADAACHLPANIPQQPSSVADRMENHHKRYQEHSYHFRTSRTGLHSTPTSDTHQGDNQLGLHNSLSWVKLDKRLTWSPHIDQVRRSTSQRMIC
jgi:hypothetical protein